MVVRARDVSMILLGRLVLLVISAVLAVAVETFVVRRVVPVILVGFVAWVFVI